MEPESGKSNHKSVDLFVKNQTSSEYLKSDSISLLTNISLHETTDQPTNHFNLPSDTPSSLSDDHGKDTSDVSSDQISLERSSNGDRPVLNIGQFCEPKTLKVSNVKYDRAKIEDSGSKSTFISSLTTNAIQKQKNFYSQLTTDSLSYFSEDVSQTKSILTNRSEQMKKGSSKATIQWQNVSKEKLNDQFQTRTISSPVSQLMIRGSQRKHIRGILNAIQVTAEFSKKDSAEERFAERKSGISSLLQDLGNEILTERQYVELTWEQEEKLKEMKQQIKLKNDTYLQHHPELGVLLSLIYKQLSKHLPEDPVPFVADYIHYLNTHREEMVLEPDVDVPFDRVQKEEVIQDMEHVTEFARTLVERCVKISSRGAPYVNVMNILDSMLHTVNPSKDEIACSAKYVKSATDVVSGILMSLITSVAEQRVRRTELFTSEILNAILDNICPTVRTGSQMYLEMMESVKLFVMDLLENVVDNAVIQAEPTEMSTTGTEYVEPLMGLIETSGLDIYSSTKSILKKNTEIMHMENSQDSFQNEDESKNITEESLQSKVRFKNY